MGEKGQQTKKMIRMEAKKLFAEKGFSQVTMKDICEATGLSRGGLYRHYESTAEIFEEIFLELSNDNESLIDQRIGAGIPAMDILKEEMQIMKEEMMNPQDSLSLPIYEYANMVDSKLFEDLNEKGMQKWQRLMKYGVQRGEFIEEHTSEAITMILYAYQGIRMWSRVIALSPQVVQDYENSIIQLIKK
ncbi:MAG TPA: TetR/AcrR family transcriptional regulator [Lachnospiraceae bacterium]|nr:TetR/AcrR family transcriptional regulator [Lachnospiraceae bacterium]